MIVFQQKRNSFMLRYSSNKFSFQPWVHANKKWHIKLQSHVKVNRKLSSNDFFFLFLIKECHWNYNKLHIHDYVICLFLLIDCLYWQVLSLSIFFVYVYWNGNLKRKAKKLRLELSHAVHIFSRNAMFTTFLQQIVSATYNNLL